MLYAQAAGKMQQGGGGCSLLPPRPQYGARGLSPGPSTLPGRDISRPSAPAGSAPSRGGGQSFWGGDTQGKGDPEVPWAPPGVGRQESGSNSCREGGEQGGGGGAVPPPGTPWGAQRRGGDGHTRCKGVPEQAGMTPAPPTHTEHPQELPPLRLKASPSLQFRGGAPQPGWQ